MDTYSKKNIKVLVKIYLKGLTGSEVSAIDAIKGVSEKLYDFCKNKFEELIIIEKQRRDIKRIKIVTFTIPYLYTDVYKCDFSMARNILMGWTRSGIVYAVNNRIKVCKSKKLINIYGF